MKKYAKDSKTIERRKRVIERLQQQLKRGKKPALVTTTGGSAVWGEIPLEEKDTVRINKEINTLTERI